MPHLPLELVRMIVSNVAASHEPLYPLLLISKEFLNEACQELYRHIVIKADDKRYQLPLNNAKKRSYYASLVKHITIESCRLWKDILRILKAVVNLKTLEILGDLHDHWDAEHIIRPDYSFELDSFACNAMHYERLIEFFQSQPTIKTIAWDPTPPWQSIGATPADHSCFPHLENMKTRVSILGSDIFTNGKIRRLYIEPYSKWQGNSLPGGVPLAASRYVKSLVLLTTSAESNLASALGLFPFVKYLDGYWSLVSCSFC